MTRAFKKFRIQRTKEKEKAKEKPKTRKVQEIHTHGKEHSEVEKIFYCLSIPNRRKTAYRKIIDLEEAELERNIILVSERLLEATVSFESIDKLFYLALRRILSLRNSVAMHGLLVQYFIASVLCGSQCDELGLFLIKHAPATLIRNRDSILPVLPQGELKTRLQGLEAVRPFSSIAFGQRVFVLRDQVLPDTRK